MTTKPTAKSELTIAPPGDKSPLKNNVFDLARVSNGTLQLLFPYIDEGSIVPTVNLMWGRPGGRYGTFVHSNTEDEVYIAFGAHGPSARSGTGLVRVGNKTHPVGGTMEDENDPESVVLSTVTVRQPEGRGQNESVFFLCEKCKKEVSRHDFEAVPPKPGQDIGRYPVIGSIAESEVAAAKFNASEENRTCPECGHVNERFPVERWGWSTFVGQSDAVRRARTAMDEVINREK